MWRPNRRVSLTVKSRYCFFLVLKAKLWLRQKRQKRLFIVESEILSEKMYLAFKLSS